MRGHNPAARSDPTAAPVASHPPRTVGSDGAELPESVYLELWRILEDEAERQSRDGALVELDPSREGQA